MITVAEAAAVLRVREEVVRGWIDAGSISYVTLASGEHRIRLLDEQQSSCGPTHSSFRILELGRGIDPETRAAFVRDRRRRQRELELDGLDCGPVDVEALTSLIADRLRAVVPDPSTVTAADGMVRVAGAGIDVAHMISHSEGGAQERVRVVGERALQIASEALSEITMDPWPAEPRQFPGGFPPCNANIANGGLSLSYGDPENPILTLQPIALSDVID
ncbi:MAG: hypothetical protein ACLP22_06990 [Solirubrobacteraceae bacterium]